MNEWEKHAVRTEVDGLRVEQLCEEEARQKLDRRLAALEARVAALEAAAGAPNAKSEPALAASSLFGRRTCRATTWRLGVYMDATTC